MKRLVIKMHMNISNRMRKRILKGFAILTALGTLKKVENLPRQLHTL
jgi:hypothetical protein